MDFLEFWWWILEKKERKILGIQTRAHTQNTFNKGEKHSTKQIVQKRKRKNELSQMLAFQVTHRVVLSFCSLHQTIVSQHHPKWLMLLCL